MLPRITLALFVVVLVALPASAHSPDDLNLWLEEWSYRYESAWLDGSDLAILDAEYAAMLERHPGWDGLPVEPTPIASPAPPLAHADPPPRADRGMGSGVEQWRGLVSAYDWNVEVALCLMSHESGGNPNAQNRSSGASGLMQVLPSWADNFGYAPVDLFIPEVNLSISYALYLDGGWNHWSPWLRGSCR